MNYPQSKIDIILLSCNRVENTKKTIDRIYYALKYPEMINLIVVDNESVDGTYEYLQEEVKNGRVHILETCPDVDPITKAYNIGFKHVTSDYFLMSQDDIDIPRLEQKDVIEQLIDLMEKYPDHGGIGLRIERIPNMNWSLGNEDLAPARKALSCYFRIQRKEDYEKMGMLNERKAWDDINFLERMRACGKECSWTKNIWCSHARGYCLDRAYLVKPRKWGWAGGIHSRMNQAIFRKPYPRVDVDTCIPLPGEKIYR